MDTTPEYIKMCEKATEIQEHKEGMGDYYCILWGETEDNFPYNEEGVKVVAREMADTYTEDEYEGLSYEQILEKWVNFFLDKTNEEWETEFFITEEFTTATEKQQEYKENHSRLVRLPRQDDLQEMWAIHEYGNERANNWTTFVLDQFSYWVLSGNAGLSTLDISMEQLWLAFVMKELYGKVWNGTDWIVK